tara:strand:- start:1223 stop:1351 length:129 start_codon:yes stop_codon:yes gene_type:complete
LQLATLYFSSLYIAKEQPTQEEVKPDITREQQLETKDENNNK